MRTLRNVGVALLTLLLVFCLGCANVATSPRNPIDRVDVTGLQDAVTVAISALRGQSHYTEDKWTLISANQILIKSRYVWRITFKPSNMLPMDPSKEMIGAGGEVFVNVDPVTKKTVVGFGE